MLCLALAVLVICGIGCSHKRTAVPTDAHLTADSYTNSFFGFELKIPANWIVLNKIALENTNRPITPPQRIRDPFSGGWIVMPDVEMHDLITLVQDTNALADPTMTALATTNVAFTVFGHNVQPLNEIHTGKDYLGFLAGVFATLARSDHDLHMSGPSEINISGRKFYHVTFQRTARAKQASGPVFERIYTRVEGGYALVFVLSAPTEGELNKLEQVLAAVRFY
jgi:hypothetical protein